MDLVSLYESIRQDAGTGSSNWPLYQPLMIAELGPVVKQYLTAVNQRAQQNRLIVTLLTQNLTWNTTDFNSKTSVLRSQ